MPSRNVLRSSALVGVVVCLALAIVGGVSTSAAGAGRLTGTSLSPQAQAKEAFINHLKASAAVRNPHPVAPNRAASSRIVVQPCTRDLSLLISGYIKGPIASDFPSWQAYTFNNQWVDPSGLLAVSAGNVLGSSQGVVSVEHWAAPTDCVPSHIDYLAPTDSGSLTILSIAGSTVSFSSTAGTNWSFDLGSDKFQQNS
jgi:hypothetical protein